MENVARVMLRWTMRK